MRKLSYYHITKEPLERTAERPPVIFMLHGYGSHENDLFSFAHDLPKNTFIISVRAPHSTAYGGYAWFDIQLDEAGNKWSDNHQAIACRDELGIFIDNACEKYFLDIDRVSLVGFSQGAILGYALALSSPNKIKNLVALSGYINTDIIHPDYKSFKFSSLDIYASHGEHDQIISIEWAKKTPLLLNDLSINHVFETYLEGHTISKANFESFKNWLKKRT